MYTHILYLMRVSRRSEEMVAVEGIALAIRKVGARAAS